MISIALRNLLSEKTRLAISVGGVAFSVMLILIILSLYQGWRIKSTEYIRGIQTDYWVTQSGSADITNSASFIPNSVEADIKKIDGVTSVSKFMGKPVNFKVKNKEVNAYIVGFDINNPVAGPSRMVVGKDKPNDGEILIDKVMSRSKNLDIGDFIEIFGKTFKIVGITDGANMFLFQFAFINQNEAVKVLRIDGYTSFFLVKTQADKREQVRAEIGKIGGVEALDKSEFVERNRRSIDEVFLPIITVLVLISVLVGTTVIGLTIYTATIEKAREFGVLKALGGSNMQIYRIIFEQAFVAGFFGYGLGVGLTYFFLWAIPYAVPGFVTTTRLIDLGGVFLLAIAMSTVASYIPVRRILSIDPAEVFRS